MEITIAEINELLYHLGVTANYTGFFHTAHAIKLCVERQDRLVQVTKLVYPEVAQEFGTNWKAVERNIRTIVGVVWKNNQALLAEMAQRPLEKRPCTSQFLAILSSYILNQKKNSAENGGRPESV